VHFTHYLTAERRFKAAKLETFYLQKWGTTRWVDRTLTVQYFTNCESFMGNGPKVRSNSKGCCCCFAFCREQDQKFKKSGDLIKRDLQ